jgi:hypothetical protein
MIGKPVAALAVVASCLVTGSASIQAGAKSRAASESSPWWDTNYNTAQSRDNLTEKVLTPSAVRNVRYLRSVVSGVEPPKDNCGGPTVSPVLAGGYLYVMASGALSKYNAATGSLVWRSVPDPTFSEYYNTVDVAGSGLVIVAGSYCFSASEPPGDVYAINASTGALVWHSTPTTEEIDGAVVTKSDIIASGTDAAGYTIAVLNLSNGKTVWTGGGCQGGTDLPLQVGNLVMTYDCDSQGNEIPEARNLTTGAVVWSLPGFWRFQRGDLGGSQGTHLYATDPSGAVVDLNPQTGKVQYTLSGAVNVLAVDSSRVYATCGSQGADLCAYSTSTGGLEWQDTQFGTAALAADADGVLYLDQGDALNAATGHVIKILWSQDVYGPATALAVGDGRIAVSIDPRVVDLFGLPGY